MEDALMRELATLSHRGVSPPLGEDGESTVTLEGGAAGAAISTYGGFFRGAQSTAGYLLAAEGARLVAAVYQGNEKHTSTMVAGGLALSELYQHTLGSRRSADPADDLRRAFEGAHRRIREVGASAAALQRWTFASCFTAEVRDLRGIGCSLTALVASGSDIAIAHVGEGRALRCRGDRVERLTADHTLAGHPEYLARLSPETAPLHAEVVLKALGVAEEPAELDHLRLAARPGDLFILGGSLTRAVDVPAVLRGPGAAELPALCRALRARAPLDDHPLLSATFVAIRPGV